MCGIAGVWDPAMCDRVALDELAKAMGDAIVHRGPDSGGVWSAPERGYAVAHRRLAILDLTPDGHQPMASRDERYIVAFNGEIYNFNDIRKDLEAERSYIGRGHSDTEVLVEAIAAWGIDTAVNKAAGMFAIAVWDNQDQVLTLIRDRIGKKPVYFGWLEGGGFVFASELKALWQHPRLKREICRNALTEYLRYCYVPGSMSIYQNIYKLPAGTSMRMDAEGASLVAPSGQDVHARIKPYWSIQTAVDQGQANPFTGNDNEAIDELERFLGEAVDCRMISDVPLGAFLSGGVDSSVVVAMMQKISSTPVRTFSIGYDHKHYNEAEFARDVAKHLGTDHTEFIVSAQDAQAVIPDLPTYYNEPFADSSQIPTFLVSKLARGHVTVALSGDGGDEVFGGYNRHLVAPRIWARIKRLPYPARIAIASMLNAVSPRTWDCAIAMSPLRNRYALVGDKIHKIARLMPSADMAQLYRSVCSIWQDPARVVLGGSDQPYSGKGLNLLGGDFTQWMKQRDMETYLTDDIMTKVDRASMAVSLEARAPLLDHRLIEWAWRLPVEMNIRDGQGKWVLRQVLYRHIPQTLIDRPKMGFGIPIVDWLRTDLRDWAESLLDERRLAQEGFFDPKPIRKLWDQHLSNARNAQLDLWAILMFQAWLEKQKQLD